jgi:diguanylate cyclase (GGDEF)-like protein
VLRRQKPQQVAQEDIREKERLEALDNLEIIDAPRDEFFDRTVALIKSIFDVSIALVSVMDAHRQVYKACEGLVADEYERKNSFCAHTILETRPMILQDITKDRRFADHPLVVGPPHLRFYAGVPLRTRDGHNVGTICAIDTRPHSFGANEVAILENLAEMTMDYIELRRMAAFDLLTGVMSRRAFTVASERAFALAQRHKHDLSQIILDIDHFKSINDTYGHAVGDEVLAEVASVCTKTVRSTDILGRIGGEEFAVLLPHTDAVGAFEVAEKLRKALAALPFEPGGTKHQVTASFGIATLDPSISDLESLTVRADGALYRAKAEGRNRCVASRNAGSRSSPPRRRVLLAAELHFDNRRPPMDCTVVTLGEDGAGISISNAQGLPEAFTLAIRTENIQARCSVTSKTEKHIEVTFLG